MRTMLLAIGLAAASAGAAHAETWRTYVNDRFGATAEYPDRFSVRAEAPTNGDGQRFFTADRRATLSIFGFLDAEDETPRRIMEGRKAAGTTYTLASAKGRTFTLSGLRGDRITYERCLRSGRDRSIFVCVELEYPAEDRKAFDPIVKRAAASLRAGKPW